MTLGIIAGGGRLPLELAESCRTNGRAVFMLAFEHITEPKTYAPWPHKVVRLGAVGEAMRHLRTAGVKELVLAGSVRRPKLADLKPDSEGVQLLKRIGKAYFFGDDALLKAVVSFLEEAGFSVVGANDIVNALAAEEGVLGIITPQEKHRRDISIGMQAAKALGARDEGQAVIVENGNVLACEDAAGTDAMLKRVSSKGGVLVKAAKPNQETRADLPSIGMHTIEAAHAAGLSGIALEAGASLILDKENTVARADALGLFIVGVRA